MIALLENLKTHLPFSLLESKSFMLIQESAQIAYYPENTILIEPKEMLQTLFVIIKGRVEAKENDELIDIYQSLDTFGGIELIEGQPSNYQYSVTEELICYEIPAETFLQLCMDNNAFKTYFFATIVERIEMLKEYREHVYVADMMVARIDTGILHPACLVDAHTPVVQALTQMEANNAAALIVKNPDGYGIVTDADFRKYILRKEEEDLSEISQIQTYPIISIEEGELLFNVLLLMTEHSIKHLPVFDKEKNLLGVLELIDLLSLFSNQSHLITVQIDRAENLESVILAAKRVHMMIRSLHTKGMKSRYIAKLVSEIHKKMYKKLFEIILPGSWQGKCAFVLLGSEGREEQMLRTDQDNALVFEDGFMPADIQEVTQQFSNALTEIGFPVCEGNVMVTNPKWCKSLSAYKKDIYHWVEHPDHEGFMDMAIFYDSMAVAGEVSLHQTLQTYLMSQINAKKQILPHFAKAIETFESPLGLFSRFISRSAEHKNEIDIKKGALFALVHGVRTLALEHGITQNNTTLRIKALNDIGYFSEEDASDLLETLEVIHTLRLHSQLEKLEKNKVIDNYISITTLGKLERDILKEALKTVEQFKKRVSYHFHLSMVS